MGDRSNIFFRNGKGGIGVYAHWAGLSMADAAMRVIQSKAFKARVGDANYATRIGVQIVLDALGAEVGSDTGFGLWTPLSGADDNEHNYVVVDVMDGSVFVAKDWRKPKKTERVAKPTKAELRKRMCG